MQLRTEIEISAPPAAVWATLTEFARYTEWNPFIARVEGELRVGSRLEVTITPPDGRDMTFRPTILVAEPNTELRWRGQFLAKSLFTGEHFFKLVEVAPGKTRFHHGEDFSGMLVKLLGRSLTQTARGFVFMNQALKKRVEAAPRPINA